MGQSKPLQTMKAKRIQQSQTCFATNAKRTSLGRKEKIIIRNKKIQMEKATDKGKHTVEVGNYLHTNMI